MSKTYIPKALRQKVAAQAKYRCGFCLSQEKITGFSMEVDHIVPETIGGPTVEENLWLACSFCNTAKNNRASQVTARKSWVSVGWHPPKD
jgi:5-methylcytosine-specific restriction endonuclease McrA